MDSEVYNHEIRLELAEIPVEVGNVEYAVVVAPALRELGVDRRNLLALYLLAVVSIAGNYSVAAVGYQAVVSVQRLGGLERVRLRSVLGGALEVMVAVLVVNAVAAGDGVANELDLEFLLGGGLSLADRR